MLTESGLHVYCWNLNYRQSNRKTFEKEDSLRMRTLSELRLMVMWSLSWSLNGPFYQRFPCALQPVFYEPQLPPALNILKNICLNFLPYLKQDFVYFVNFWVKLLIFISSLISRFGRVWMGHIHKGRKKNEQDYYYSSPWQTLGH